MAKRRIGKASRSEGTKRPFLRALARPAAGPTEFVRRRSGNHASEAGFTLIELVVVTAILPIIVGAIAMGLISIFSLQASVSNRLTDSGDAQIVSANFQNDVQSAVQITTYSTPTSPAPCLPNGSSQTQVMELQLGNGTDVTYGVAPAPSGSSYDLWRDSCLIGASQPTTTLLAHDLPQSVTTTPPVSVTCTTSSPACVTGPPNNTYAYQNGWVSTLGVTGVTFKVTAPLSNYTYSVTSTPVATANSSQLATPSIPSTGCGTATPTTGTYTPPNPQTLCFVDFSPWNSLTAAKNVSCANPISPTNLGGALAMSAQVANTPYTLNFCMSVSGSWNSNSGKSGPITGQTSAAAACGVAARTGYNDISAVPLPTYACPPSSEAFLGNNGFYTGVPGDPGLYTVEQGSTAVLTFTDIQLVSSTGAVATNWNLVTGDAESTDQGESITWQSDKTLSLVPNSPTSPVGNACDSTPPGYNASSLTGVGTTTVECFNSPSEDHTGTVMLQALTPSSLTVTLVGTGLQAMFLGVLT